MGRKDRAKKPTLPDTSNFFLTETMSNADGSETAEEPREQTAHETAIGFSARVQLLEELIEAYETDVAFQRSRLVHLTSKADRLMRHYVQGIVLSTDSLVEALQRLHAGELEAYEAAVEEAVIEAAGA